MIAVPFIYFSAFLVYILKTKRTFDISAYLVSLYLISSFFSILIDVNDLRSYDTKEYSIGVLPTILYCFLLTITILPFYGFKGEKVHTIHLNKPHLFDKIVYFYFACFLLISISSFGSVIQILSGDFGEMRRALYKGEVIADLPKGGGVFQPVFIVANIFGGFSMVMLLFYFYSVCFLKKSRIFNTIILLSSLTIIIIGILGVDRSKTFYWIISYGFMLVMFWRYMSEKQRKNTVRITLFLLSAVVSYLLAITVSRFGERETGTQGGLISYAGQSFINFCFFFEEVEYNELSLQRIFPLTYKLFVENGIESSGELNAEISFRTGKSIGVFSTFIGDILVASGKAAAFIYCLTLSAVANKLVRFRNVTPLCFHHILMLFCLISIPMLGVFVHFYAGFPNMIAFLSFVLLSYYMRSYRRFN